MLKYNKLPTHILRDDCFSLLMKRLKPGSFLEVGPGSGNTTILFLRNGFTGTCFDISKESREMLAVNLSEYSSHVKIIDKLEFAKKDFFDYLFLFDVIEHIKDDAAILRELTEHLRPGGTLLISVPAHMSEFGTSDELMGHFRRYEKEELCSLLERCGYKEVRVLNYGFPLVNLTLRGINFLYCFSQNKVRSDYGLLSTEERTKKSGVKSPAIVSKLLFFFNSFTLLPFILLQRMFFKKDWGVAYIAYAIKS